VRDTPLLSSFLSSSSFFGLSRFHSVRPRAQTDKETREGKAGATVPFSLLLSCGIPFPLLFLLELTLALGGPLTGLLLFHLPPLFFLSFPFLDGLRSLRSPLFFLLIAGDRTVEGLVNHSLVFSTFSSFPSSPFLLPRLGLFRPPLFSPGGLQYRRRERDGGNAFLFSLPPPLFLDCYWVFRGHVKG